MCYVNQHLSLRMAVQLAAPHTWPASVLPVLVACALTLAHTGQLAVLDAILLLVICVLMQSSVNTFNDYYDYVKGSDSANDNVETSDAVLVYNNVNPREALILAIGFLATAFALGLVIIVHAGFMPLFIALVGALFVVAYSAGKTPISYLPIGELVSGVVMGGLIPLACYQVLTGWLNPWVFAWTVPEIIGIGLIMFTNNQCDIEKDQLAGRRTMPVCLGRAKARKLYSAVLITWLVCIVVIVFLFFPRGAIVLPFLFAAAYPLLKALYANPLEPRTRIGAMAQVCSVNVVLGSFYALCIVTSGYALTFSL